MRERQAFTPTTLDRLENRVALSHGMMAPAQVVPVETTSPRALALNLQGTVRGLETPSPLASALPGDLLLRGRGQVVPLGRVHLVGTFSIRSGEPTFYDGTVTLSNRRGNIRVHIFGIMGGALGPPAHLRYEILSGSGAYDRATGQGNVVYDRSLPVVGETPFSLTFGNPIATATA